ncbi:patatin-like phospholipase family protein [Halosimplex salinum]|uniref:patatin-like phospholipase family protein n=1 Tax=Halosimplex salinum TaxID=1710538 RepID=UPI0013DE7617|nr:patatin-like phospholipase family protein [Halosimplex salinum]
MASDSTSVAIACQGGGSHTAFAAGALARLFEELPGGYVVDGLSGTSGGAITAAAAWDALRTDGPDAVPERVRALWRDIAAGSLPERAANDVGVWVTALETAGFPLPSVSPYANPAAWAGRRELRDVIERFVDFDRPVRAADPRLFVSSVDVLSGEFRAFGAADLRPRVLLASAAAPTVFPAVDLDGVPHWDGLFARNPPVSPFLSEPDRADEKPDEIWIFRVNPMRRDREPRSQRAIADRRSELSGDISLTGQVGFVDRVSDWVERGWLPRERYKPVTVRGLTLSEQLPLSSRLDRDPDLICGLLARGEAAADSLLAELD